jgi:hypothetical protein
MTEIGNLRVRIGADTGDLTTGLRQAQGQLQNFRRAIAPALTAIAAVGAAATAAAGGIAAMTRAGMNNIDEQAKLARGLGGTTAALQALDRAAGRAGVASGELQSATLRLNQRLGQAVIEGGAAADALARIGLRANDLIAMDIDERMATLSDAMRQAGMNSQQMAFTLRELGIRQSAIVNLMQEGGDAIRDSRTAIEELGAAVNDVDARAVERANDAMAEFGIIIQGIQNRLAVEFAPIIEELADRISQMVREAGGFGPAISQGMEAAVKSVGMMLDTFHNVRVSAAAIEALIARWDHVSAQFALRLWQTVGAVLDRIADKVNGIIEGLNSIAGVDIELVTNFSDGAFMKGVEQNAKKASDAAWEAVWAHHELAHQDMPSDKIARFFEDVQRRREEALAGLGDREANLGMIFGDDDDDDSARKARRQQEKEIEQLRNHLATRLQAIREGVMNEQELEVERFAQRMEELEQAHQHELIAEEEFQKLKEEMELQHQERLAGIFERGAEERRRAEERVSRDIMAMRNAVVQQSVGLLNQFAGESKAAAVAAIALNKGLMIAQTIQNTAAAQMRAMAELGPIAGPPAAAKIGAMGKMQTALIAATGLAQAAGSMRGGASGGVGAVGGIGGAAGAGPGSGAAAAQQQENKQINAVISLQGDVYTRKSVEKLIEQINDLQADGMRVNLRM